MAIDVSASVDEAEQALQTGGLAAALRDPDVLSTMLLPDGSAVALTAFTWSGRFDQQVIAPWTLVRSAADAERVARRIETVTPRRRQLPTAIGSAMYFAARLHRAAPMRCGRQVIDVAGDGIWNAGVTPYRLREWGELDGFEINGLVIRGESPDPFAYYQREVIQGPGAFVLSIDGYDAYQDGMKRKLLRELTPRLSRGPGDRRPAAGGAGAAPVRAAADAPPPHARTR